MRQLGPVARVLSTIFTITILIAYGLALKYAAEHGHLWWALSLGLIATTILYFVVTSKDERRKGNEEMAENFRRLNPWKRR